MEESCYTLRANKSVLRCTTKMNNINFHSDETKEVENESIKRVWQI